MELFMEEHIYSVEIKKSVNGYLGILSNNNNEIKQFKNRFFNELMQDIIDDITLDFDTSNETPKDYFEEDADESY